MGVVALMSAKGAPGVTTTAVGLSARWPGPTVLVEADPAGGDLAARFGAHRSPGVPEWAAASRLPGMQVPPAVQQLPGLGIGVVFGGSVEQMPTALSLLASSGNPLAAVATGVRTARDVLLDLGRIEASAAVLGLAAAADVVLIVSHGWADSLDAVAARRERLLSRLRTLRGPDADQPKLKLLLVGEVPFGIQEIEETLKIAVAGRLPHDERGAQVLNGRRGPGQAWTRSPLLRACRTLAVDLHASLDPSEFGSHHRVASAPGDLHAEAVN